MSVSRADPSLPSSSWFSYLAAVPPPPSPREIKDFVFGGRDSKESLDPYRREVREGQVQWCLAVLLLVIASVLLVVILVEESSEQPTGSQMLITHYVNTSTSMLLNAEIKEHNNSSVNSLDSTAGASDRETP